MTSEQPSKNPIDSGKTFFDISVNTGQICIKLRADTPENDSNLAILCEFRRKFWLKSNWRATEVLPGMG